MSETRTKKASRLAALAAVALLASACGNAGTAGAGAVHHRAAHASPASLASPAASPAARAGAKADSTPAPDGGSGAAPSAQPSAATAPTDPPACSTADLSVSLERGDGAAGSVFWRLVMSNKSDHPCTTGGFSGVSYVDGHGNQVGSAAEWTDQAEEQVVLDPGAAASATLQETNAMNYPTDKCRPTPAAGLRVFPPHQTDSTVVPHSATACADPDVHLLTLSPLHAEQ